MTEVISSSVFNHHGYADDTQLYNSFKLQRFDEMCSNLSECATNVDSWMTCNKLKNNTDKMEIMLCGTQSKLKSTQANNVEIGSDTISFSANIKNLGVFLEQNLSMNCHVSYIRKCCYFEVRKIAHLRPFIDEKSTIKLVVSLVLSKLDYCNCLFYNMTNQNFHKLQLVQNHAARLVKKQPRTSSATLLLKELHWLPIKFRVLYKICIIVFKCLNEVDFPSYLSELLTIYTPSRTLRSLDTNRLVKPLMKLSTFGQRSFFYAAPQVWNDLPIELRMCTSLPLFKNSLETYYFRVALY
jgi:GTPase SAR1 family protein